MCKYFQKNCDNLQTFQVLSYDYEAEIQNHLDRESTLHQELDKKSDQISQLRDVVNQSKHMIKNLFEHIHESKGLK